MNQTQNPPHTQPLANKVILVTGASEGIGRATAKAFAQAGATVILSGRNQSRLESCYDDIIAATNTTPSILPFDLSSTETQDYQMITDAIDAQYGQLHGLIHNAGILGKRCDIASLPFDDWQRVLQINLNAPLLLTKAMLPLLRIPETASVLFTSSSVGRQGRAFWGGYAVSKFAIEGLMQVLADELENTSHIRINSFNPGATATAMRHAAFPGEDQTTLPQPESLAPYYIYLMSDASQAIRGQALNAKEITPV